MIGKRLKVRVTTTVNPRCGEQIDVIVHEEYPKFLVLDTGKFKFCAYKDEIKRKEAISI